MTKPNTDLSQRAQSSRLREFVRHERESGLHPAIEALRSRPKQRSLQNRKAVEYTRIERGRLS